MSETLHLTVKRLAADPVDVDIPVSANVGDLMDIVAGKLPDWPKERQLLIFRGRRLHAETPLGEVGISSGDKLHLVPRPRSQEARQAAEARASARASTEPSSAPRGAVRSSLRRSPLMRSFQQSARPLPAGLSPSFQLSTPRLVSSHTAQRRSWNTLASLLDDSIARTYRRRAGVRRQRRPRATAAEVRLLNQSSGHTAAQVKRRRRRVAGLLDQVSRVLGRVGNDSDFRQLRNELLHLDNESEEPQQEVDSDEEEEEAPTQLSHRRVAAKRRADRVASYMRQLGGALIALSNTVHQVDFTPPTDSGAEPRTETRSSATATNTETSESSSTPQMFQQLARSALPGLGSVLQSVLSNLSGLSEGGSAHIVMQPVVHHHFESSDANHTEINDDNENGNNDDDGNNNNDDDDDNNNSSISSSNNDGDDDEDGDERLNAILEAALLAEVADDADEDEDDPEDDRDDFEADALAFGDLSDTPDGAPANADYEAEHSHHESLRTGPADHDELNSSAGGSRPRDHDDHE
ncbi:MAG: hypothetical protein MHM6MM_000268 [Cercozoa sp. M6MM]